jgi:hypothetical protein
LIGAGVGLYGVAEAILRLLFDKGEIDFQLYNSISTVLIFVLTAAMLIWANRLRQKNMLLAIGVGISYFLPYFISPVLNSFSQEIAQFGFVIMYVIIYAVLAAAAYFEYIED